MNSEHPEPAPSEVTEHLPGYDADLLRLYQQTKRFYRGLMLNDKIDKNARDITENIRQKWTKSSYLTIDDQ